ncbi:hypothetical protein VNI00_008001 [Paramarasmius palmivorus]|uniref:Uncharacterized protein n=1 Tax=Paramarasmius palmivorus TaxID=297713 RepID=A0AAW0CXA0_9AGAR
MSTNNDYPVPSIHQCNQVHGSDNISPDAMNRLLEEFCDNVKRLENLPQNEEEFQDLLGRLAVSLRMFSTNGYAAQKLMSSEMLDVVHDLKRVVKLEEHLQDRVELLECEGIHIMEEAERVNKHNEQLNHQVQDLQERLREVLEDRDLIEQELCDLQEQGAR